MRLRDFILIIIFVNFISTPSLSVLGDENKASITFNDDNSSEKEQNLKEKKAVFNPFTEIKLLSYTQKTLLQENKFTHLDEIIEEDNFSDIIIPPPDFS